jgi:hypothetical protein
MKGGEWPSAGGGCYEGGSWGVVVTSDFTYASRHDARNAKDHRPGWSFGGPRGPCVQGMRFRWTLQS